MKLPSAVPPDLPVRGDLNGVLPAGAAACVPVLPLPLGLGVGAQRGGEDLLGGLKQAVRRGALPVGDGTRDLVVDRKKLGEIFKIPKQAIFFF